MSRTRPHEAADAVEQASDSDGPEEEANASRKRSIKGLDRSRRVVGKRPRAGPSRVEETTLQAVSGGSRDEEESKSASTSSPTSSHLLDPSLFAASFEKHQSQTSSRSLTSALKSPAPVASKKKRFGLTKGRDGQPMRRLNDGRTTVRVLQKTPSSVEMGASEETLAPPPPLEATQILPNARTRAFRKNKLGLREKSREVRVEGVKAPARTEEDPLGLQDPAFMKGGEFEGVGLKPKPKSIRRQSVQRPGARTRFSPAMTKQNQALNFARSM